VVFSHGWPLNADAWEDQMSFLATHGYRCIAHDRRGQQVGPALEWQRHGQPDMPESAIASGYIDFILSPEDIAKEIVKITQLQGDSP
jgi:pimeloyl-ACP methyl ester carboxylesterase